MDTELLKPLLTFRGLSDDDTGKEEEIELGPDVDKEETDDDAVAPGNDDADESGLSTEE